MNFKTISAIFLIIVVLLAVAACNANPQGEQREQPPAPEANVDIVDNTQKAETFDLKPDGCDVVCVLGSYLGLND
ncbi:MAG: hypothetical protein K8R77_06045 [Anaerolineaceae bacterium]|nr:hypothetical protein [Anaerolineaceae bacterium]